MTNLNADLLDGNHASAFLGVSATAADSDKLDGLHAASFWQSGGSTVSLSSVSSGSSVATFSTTTKPGSASTNTWVGIVINGTTFYIPAWT